MTDSGMHLSAMNRLHDRLEFAMLRKTDAVGGLAMVR